MSKYNEKILKDIEEVPEEKNLFYIRSSIC